MLASNEHCSSDPWAGYLKDHPYGFFITLNTNRHLPNGLTPRVKDELLALEQPTRHIVSDLRRFCLGRQCSELKDSIRAVAVYEVGARSGLLHVHLLFVHDGCVLRSGEDIANRLQRDCPKHQFGKWAFTTDIDVSPLGDVDARLKYMRKQTAEMLFATGERTLTAF